MAGVALLVAAAPLVGASAQLRLQGERSTIAFGASTPHEAVLTAQCSSANPSVRLVSLPSLSLSGVPPAEAEAHAFVTGVAATCLGAAASDLCAPSAGEPQPSPSFYCRWRINGGAQFVELPPVHANATDLYADGAPGAAARLLGTQVFVPCPLPTEADLIPLIGRTAQTVSLELSVTHFLRRSAAGTLETEGTPLPYTGEWGRNLVAYQLPVSFPPPASPPIPPSPPPLLPPSDPPLSLVITPEGGSPYSPSYLSGQPIILGAAGRYTLVWHSAPAQNFEFKMWGAGGATQSQDNHRGAPSNPVAANYGGGGGFVSGDFPLTAGAPYIVVVGTGGTCRNGQYGSLALCSGGGYTGVFEGSESHGNVLLLAGGGGGGGFGDYSRPGAGGGPEGQDAQHGSSPDGAGAGGTQSGGGNRGPNTGGAGSAEGGSALQGGRSESPHDVYVSHAHAHAHEHAHEHEHDMDMDMDMGMDMGMGWGAGAGKGHWARAHARTRTHAQCQADLVRISCGAGTGATRARQQWCTVAPASPGTTRALIRAAAEAAATTVAAAARLIIRALEAAARASRWPAR